MPITKVPIQHKFGIISHSQRLELQERLLKQSYLASLQSRKSQTQSRNPLEVTEEFVQQYNNAKSLDEQERMEDLAFKMLERVKRRAGLREGGVGSYVDLPIAWTELSQLSQCKGKIQEECLDVLITSLDQAPLNRIHIPALFFLAETCLYWLRTDAVNQPYLRTGEIKLLKMGQLVFIRMFYHHMAGNLRGFQEFKNRLFTYLDGLQECQDAYNPYPNAMLSLRIMIEVGKILVSDVVLEAADGNMAEGSGGGMENSMEELFHEVPSKFERTRSSQSGAISSSVHDLSPTLWHSLDVYRCTNQVSGGLTDALRALGHCGMGLSKENWVDGMCALVILAEAAKTNMKALKVLQNLARGIVTRATEMDPGQKFIDEIPTKAPAKEAGSGKDSVFLSDIAERTEDGGGGTEQYSHQSMRSDLDDIEQHEETFDINDEPGNMDPRQQKLKREVTYMSRKVTRESQRTKAALELEQTAGWKAQFGEEEGRGSQASAHTYTNEVVQNVAGLHGWHWEVATTYTDILADICLHGATSNIQKIALVGFNKDLNNLHKMSYASIPLVSAGLLDMAYFHAKEEADDKGPNDWSWRVRYGAIQGLVKLCRCLAGDKNKEGLRTVAWNALLRVNSLEKDERVLEALKVGQVGAKIESLLSQHMRILPSTIGAKIAEGLAKVYLPPLPPPVDVPQRKPRLSRVEVGKSKPIPRKPLRTSLQEEIQLATALYEPPFDYKDRTRFDLNRIVEDQWRKEMQRQQEEEEQERLKALAEKRKKEEQEEKEREIRKQEKFKPKQKENTIP